MIEVKNLTKKYGSHVAVDNLNINVESGKVYGFLGPNGAGKTTTMNIITGYIGATSGTVVINGHDMFKEPEKAKKCIGYLPEIPPLYIDMTVREYLKFAADIKKLDREKKEEYIDEAMSLARVTDVKDRLIKNLSKGYKQRVGLAQAVLGFPEVIILDEPTVGLDPKQIIEIRDVIKKLGEKHTVILSSHILSEVREVCDYIFIISNGKLVASDTTENIEKLAANERLVVSVEGSAIKFGNMLQSMYQVAAYEMEQNGAVANAFISLEEHTDISGLCKEIFYKLAEEQMPILHMSTEKDSLEEVFIRLTATDIDDDAISEDNKDEDDFSDVEDDNPQEETPGNGDSEEVSGQDETEPQEAENEQEVTE